MHFSGWTLLLKLAGVRRVVFTKWDDWVEKEVSWWVVDQKAKCSYLEFARQRGVRQSQMAQS